MNRQFCNYRFVTAVLALCAMAWCPRSTLAAAEWEAGLLKIPRPQIPDKTFNIKDYGAVGDGKTMDTAAIVKAIEACKAAGGGKVVVPAGKFLTGPFKLVSNLNLHIEEGGAILMSDNPDDFPIVPDGDLGKTTYQNAITAENCHDIAITGKGAIDGQGAKWWEKYKKVPGKTADEQPAAKLVHRPHLVVLDHCQRLLFQDVLFTNSPMFHVVPRTCDDVIVEGIRMVAPDDAPNADGFDPSGRNYYITKSTFDVGDDCIAFKPSRAGSDGGIACENLLVTDCKFQHGHGMSIGGQTPKGLRRLTVRDCTFEGTDNGIRLKAARGSGGLVEDITFENITMKKVKVAVVFTSWYYPNQPKPDIINDPGKPVTETTPIWRNIRVNNVTIEGSKEAGQIAGLPEMPISNVVLTNVKISADKGLQIVHAKDIVFKDSEVTAKNGAPLTLHKAEVSGIDPATGKATQATAARINARIATNRTPGSQGVPGIEFPGFMASWRLFYLVAGGTPGVGMSTTHFTLTQKDIPTHWYNVAADFPEPMAPPLHPGTRKPAGAADMAAIFAEPIIEQEMSTQRLIEIPGEVREILALWRPTPLMRAVRLEKELNTPAHIYYKYEGVSPAGSHKPNSAVAQAYYNKQAGTKRLATETGAGQWGSSLAMACRMFGIECVIYMVKVSFHQKPYRKMLMQTWGATVHPSPSDHTHFGRKVLKEHSDSPGSLGIAISEAIEDTVSTPNTKYALGSVLNHVCMHQTVIGQESIKQMELAGEAPDVVIGCAGGGSNFAGIAFPFVPRKLKEPKSLRLVAVEPESCPSLTKGEFRYDFGDTGQTTPLLMMYTLGHDFVPPKIHAGGLRYHGMAPTVSHLKKLGLIEARAYGQQEVFESAVQFARAEGIVPAPESAHAIKAAIDEAVAAREEGRKRVILFNLSGHGLMDMTAYEAYLSGHM